jgi:hypothetical protein
MAQITIDQKNLEELIDKSVHKHLKETFEDMEEIRRSPGAAVVRLETRMDVIEKNMATKADIANLRTELLERIENVHTSLGERIENVHTSLGERIGNVQTSLGERIGKLETSQKIILTILISMFSTTIALLIKIAFFP